jgi:hypothetical protein
MAAYPLYALVFQSATPVLSATGRAALRHPYVCLMGLHHSLQDVEGLVRADLFEESANYPDVHFNSAETINLEEYRCDDAPAEFFVFDSYMQLRHVASYSLNTFPPEGKYCITSIYMLELSLVDGHIRADWLDEDADDDDAAET